jgi:hypothetical protein
MAGYYQRHLRERTEENLGTSNRIVGVLAETRNQEVRDITFCAIFLGDDTVKVG